MPGNQIDLEALLGIKQPAIPREEPQRIQWDKALGKRIRHRRTQLSMSMDRVAESVG